MKLYDPKLFRQQNYINGAWKDDDCGVTIYVTNPAMGEMLGTVPKAGTAETRRALEAANAAWPAWRTKTAKLACRNLAQMVQTHDGKPG